MANLSPAIMIIILIVCVVIALVIGYIIGNRMGGHGKQAAAQEKQKHDELKADVREHFQQSSAIMSRMVEDYRAMYQHMSEGAEKLGELNTEKMVAPPPSPEAITRSNSKGDSGPAVPPPSTVDGSGADAAQSGVAQAGEPATSSASETGTPDRQPAATGDTTKPAPGEPEKTDAGADRHAAAANAGAGDSKTTATADAGTHKPTVDAPETQATGGQPSEAGAQSGSQAATGRNRPAPKGGRSGAKHVPIGSGKKK